MVEITTIANLPLYFTSISCEYEQEQVTRPYGFRSDQLMFVLSGHGVFYCDGKRFSLSPGSAVYFESKVAHSYRGFGADFKTAWLTFQGDALSSIRSHFGVKEFYVCHLSDVAPYLSLMQELRDEYEENNRETVMSAMVYRILLEFFSANAPREDTAMERAELHLIRHFREKVSLEDLVEITGFSKSKFCRMAKERWGVTAFEKLSEIRLSHACHLLTSDKRLTVADCACQSGFDDVSYFCKVFRANFQMSPTQFREGGQAL